MRLVSVFFFSVALIGMFIAMVAFSDLRNEKVIKHLQTTTDSKGFAVVELFTSEGCSSCPPADELMGRIEKGNKNESIYILTYHVDYWDRQGWKDKFSDHAFSQRQESYANWLNLSSVYTPQLVVNGANEYIGSDEHSVIGGIADALDQTPATTLTLHSVKDGGKLTISHEETAIKKNTKLVLALVQKEGESNVRAGENAGRKLSHVQIVRALKEVPAGDKKDVTLDLPADFSTQGWELIGFLQNSNNGHIIAATKVDFQTNN
ncbi:DUF1223 domain-containing protein [Chitinophaga pinensis]|uniref:DUF1223 domain-containing protein n=1 Tax=Chitinophaga pinensis (strain ATCC 43595 / DSM 2588 / LMG 13176 / NBRC 15968 / NCIMB 11800 / UQM 2034) TaxID=485918 RepID=A0A979G543_CHIPD|nr:DUF1223 domain-containing protein [Chitinophaga pinensis]ACU61080.1 protein of unknown function DUF1223 [Chitinophaga pinensis DSM 2588]